MKWLRCPVCGRKVQVHDSVETKVCGACQEEMLRSDPEEEYYGGIEDDEY